MNSERHWIPAFDSRSRWILGLLLGVVVLLAGSCSSSSPTSFAQTCTSNSDCDGSLICEYGRCHVACATSKDCAGGVTCLPPGVCELSAESTCSSTLPCVTGLTCADAVCRAPCSPGVAPGAPGGCLEGQTCTPVASSTVFVCIDNTGEGGVGAPDSSSSDGPSSDGAGSSGGSSGSSGGSSGSSGGSGGSSGGDGGNPCPNPQTTFGLIGQGDSNKNFMSGVGALGTNVMYIFSGFSVPVGDSGTGPAVYVQAFDPKTGAKKGPSESLFAPPQLVPTSTAQGITLYNSAVSPTGEIALTYVMHNTPGTDDIYVAFLNPSTGDGGTDGLSFQQAILLDIGPDFAAPFGGPKVIWSNSSQTFIVSYQYTTTNMDYLGVSVNKFFASGQTASGGVSSAPFPGEGIASESYEGNVGESGNLLGVAYFSGGGAPTGAWITILDESGNLVGSPTNLFDEYGANGSWASVAGTAQGFVYFYDDMVTPGVGEAFISTSPDAGIVGGDISGEGGLGKFPGFSSNTPALFGLAIADDVGTGGSGGVGVALIYSGGGVSFAYVNADGIGHQGPISVFPTADVMAMTNLNGSFAISAYSKAATSTQVVASGICP
jgi:hypothetical protein